MLDCTQRGGRFALPSDHAKLKKLIANREKDLKILIAESKGDLGDF